MPRTARKRDKNRPHHIMSRSIPELNLFRCEDDKDYYLSLMKTASQIYRITIIAYCLMDNHVHLLVHPYGGDISKFMKNINNTYAKYYNRNYERRGHLYDDRFKNIIIKDEVHLHTGWFSANLDTVINYIPARFTAILIVIASALLGEDYKNAWAIAKRDHTRTPSRNHGWPMAAMAGALRVQLEKPGQYILGEPTELLTPNKILRALKIRNVSLLLCVIFSLPIILLTRLYFFPY